MPINRGVTIEQAFGLSVDRINSFLPFTKADLVDELGDLKDDPSYYDKVNGTWKNRGLVNAVLPTTNLLHALFLIESGHVMEGFQMWEKVRNSFYNEEFDRWHFRTTPSLDSSTFETEPFPSTKVRLLDLIVRTKLLSRSGELPEDSGKDTPFVINRLNF